MRYTDNSRATPRDCIICGDSFKAKSRLRKCCSTECTQINRDTLVVKANTERVEAHAKLKPLTELPSWMLVRGPITYSNRLSRMEA